MPFAALDTADHHDLPLKEVPVGPGFHIRRGLSILAGRNQEEKSAWRATEGHRDVAPAEVFTRWQVERFLGVLGIWGLGLQEARLLSCALLGLQLRLVLLLFFGQSLEGGQALGVWGGNDPDRVPRDLVAVPRLEYPGQVYLDLQPPELAGANGRKPEGCSPVFVRVRLEDVGAPIEYPFEPLGWPTHHKQLLGNCHLLLLHNRATQLAVPLLRGNVCIPGRAICDHWVCPPLCLIGCAGCLRPRRAPAATFLRIAYIRPPAGKGVPSLRLDIAALPCVIAVLPLIEPKQFAASLRRSPSHGYV